jgi:hypothetical protein
MVGETDPKIVDVSSETVCRHGGDYTRHGCKLRYKKYHLYPGQYLLTTHVASWYHSPAKNQPPAGFVVSLAQGETYKRQ